MEPYVKQDLKLPQIYAQVKLFKTSLSMYSDVFVTSLKVLLSRDVISRTLVKVSELTTKGREKYFENRYAAFLFFSLCSTLLYASTRIGQYKEILNKYVLSINPGKD